MLLICLPFLLDPIIASLSPPQWFHREKLCYKNFLDIAEGIPVGFYHTRTLSSINFRKNPMWAVESDLDSGEYIENMFGYRTHYRSISLIDPETGYPHRIFYWREENGKALLWRITIDYKKQEAFYKRYESLGGRVMKRGPLLEKRVFSLPSQDPVVTIDNISYWLTSQNLSAFARDGNYLQALYFEYQTLSLEKIFFSVSRLKAPSTETSQGPKLLVEYQENGNQTRLSSYKILFNDSLPYKPDSVQFSGIPIDPPEGSGDFISKFLGKLNRIKVRSTLFPCKS